MAVFLASLQGLSFQYIWPNATSWNDRVIIVMLAGVVVFACLFTRNFLFLSDGEENFNIAFWIVIITSALNNERFARAAQEKALVYEREAREAQARASVIQSDANENLEHKVRERTNELESVNEKLAELSTTDALTGVRNRRYFDQMLAREFNRARRVANILREGVHRTTDFVARYGDEEFAIILHNTEVASAYLVADKIRKKIAQQQFDASGITFSITVSIGLMGDEPSFGCSADFWLKEADDALYKAKEGGRNKVVLSPSCPNK
jgi:PleD family two-component response regulator